MKPTAASHPRRILGWPLTCGGWVAHSAVTAPRASPRSHTAVAPFRTRRSWAGRTAASAAHSWPPHNLTLVKGPGAATLAHLPHDRVAVRGTL